MSYQSFAEVYDELQCSVDYFGRAQYLVRLFEKYDRKPQLVLDVGCGTGQISLQLKKRNIDVIGVDPSVEMLMMARENAAACGQELLLLCQSAAELDLYGTVDGAVCCLDSINHIIDELELQKSFDKISLFLEKDRLFIFDVNTEYKHREVLANNIFTYDAENVYCVWSNSECSNNGVVDICLDFFIKNSDGTYTRTGEEFSERAYSVDMLKMMLDKAGLDVVAVLDDMTLENATEKSQRIIFVTRKR